MNVGAPSGTSAPQLQTSWTRAEAACAARHRGDAYYDLTHPQPKADATTPTAPTGPEQADDPATQHLAPGFTLHL
jgi:hypothetical protein